MPEKDRNVSRSKMKGVRLLTILVVVMILGIFAPLSVIGFQQIWTFGLIGAFEPVADYFGLPVTYVATVSIVIILVFSLPVGYYMTKDLREKINRDNKMDKKKEV